MEPRKTWTHMYIYIYIYICMYVYKHPNTNIPCWWFPWGNQSQLAHSTTFLIYTSKFLRQPCQQLTPGTVRRFGGPGLDRFACIQGTGSQRSGSMLIGGRVGILMRDPKSWTSKFHVHQSLLRWSPVKIHGHMFTDQRPSFPRVFSKPITLKMADPQNHVKHSSNWWFGARVHLPSTVQIPKLEPDLVVRPVCHLPATPEVQNQFQNPSQTTLLTLTDQKLSCSGSQLFPGKQQRVKLIKGCGSQF